MSADVSHDIYARAAEVGREVEGFTTGQLWDLAAELNPTQRARLRRALDEAQRRT